MKQSVSIDQSVSDFEGKIPDVIQHLQKLLKEYGPEASVEFSTERGYYEDHSVTVCVNRQETDEEEIVRQAKQAEYLERVKKMRKAEYERLKKEFGE